MSEHAWTLEHLETYAADGLESTERERLDQHVAECPTCAQALAEVRALDRSLGSLFTDQRPEPALEDRLIRTLRIGAARRKSRLPMAIRIAIASAAVLLVGLVGATASQFVIDGELPLPGTALSSSEHFLEHPPSAMNALVENAVALAMASSRRDLEADHFEGKRRIDSNSTLVDVDGLVANSRRKAEYKLKNEDEGLDRSKMLAYNMDRIDNLSVPEPEAARKPMSSKGESREDGRVLGRAGTRAGSVDAPAKPEGEQRKALEDRGTVLLGGLNRIAGGAPQPAGAPEPDAEPGKPAYRVPAPETPLVLRGGETLTTAPFEKAGSYYSYTDNRPAPPAPPAVNSPSVPSPMPAMPVPGSPDQSRKSDVLSTTPMGLTAGGDRLGGRSGTTSGPATADYFKPADAGKGDDAKPGEQGEGAQGKGQPGDPKDRQPDSGGGSNKGTLAGEKNGRGEGQGQARGGSGPGSGNNDQEKPSPVPRKIIIRSGEIEFEIESFDSAVATATKLVNAIPNGFIATVNSEKLPNGKVRGSVVVRVPPEALDGLVLDLRKELGKVGELKGQRIGSQDITKQYTDLESRLRAAKAMETRLLEIIKTGKGEIKDLLLAEKELGVWRTKIEETEGELRYYSNMVSLSTLTITLYEKEIRTAAAVIETERVNMGVEVEDVIKSLRETQKAVTEAKGRITKSEMKQHAAGQLQAEIHFEVAPEVAGTLQDRLRQLGTVTRLQIDRLTRTEGGTGRSDEPKTKRADAQFLVSLYNVANIAPRETMQLQLAAKDAEAAYKAILARVEKAGGRVVTSNLNRQRSEQTTGTVNFEVKSGEAEAVLLDLRSEGEVLHLQSTENADTQNVTRAKRGFQVTIVSLYNAASVLPHTTVQLNLATGDAEESYRAVLARVEKAGGRVVTSNLNRQRNDQTQGTIHFEVQTVDADAVLADLRGLGEVMRLQSSENTSGQITARTKRGFQVQVWALGAVQPRETASIQLAARDVPAGYRALHDVVSKAKGRILNAQLNEQDKQNVTATLDFEVRRGEEAAIEAALAKLGTSISRNVSRAQDSETVIDTKVRFQVVLSDVNRIPPRELVTLAVDTPNVEQSLAALDGLLGQTQGRTVSRTVSHKRTGEVLANVTVDVPVAQKDSLVEKIKSFGMVRVHNADRRDGVPEHALSVARLEIVLQGTTPLVAKDDGLWMQLRKGLSTSVNWIIVSLSWALVGLLVVLPWALVSYLIVRLVKRLARRQEVAAPTTAA